MAIFTIGNFVSKILVMLLVPLYTSVLSTGEYGVADGLQTTLLLMVPLLTINAGEAALRFAIEHRDKRGSILYIMLKYVGIASFLVFLLCTFACLIIRAINIVFVSTELYGISVFLYFVLFFFMFLTNSFYESMILFCQGCERVKTMISGSVISTIMIIASNIVFLLVIKTGLWGYLMSQIIAYSTAGLFMLVMSFMAGESQDAGASQEKGASQEVGVSQEKGVSQEFDGSAETGIRESFKNDEDLEKQMVGYGSSMLLYSTSSWVNNAIDRYFVLAMCGAAVNGLYAVAYKIPAMLTVFQRIFAQAWQISANKTYDDEDSAEFFSTIYKGYQCIMCVGCAFLILFVKIIARLLFAKDFYNAWPLVMPLLISVIFGALTGFLGSICLAFKDGKSMGKATGTGALVNIILNFILIAKYDAMGAAIATAVSYFTMYMLAYRAVMGHVKLKVNRARDFIAIEFLVLESIVMMYEAPHCYIMAALCVAAVLFIYARSFIRIVKSRLHPTAESDSETDNAPSPEGYSETDISTECHSERSEES